MNMTNCESRKISMTVLEFLFSPEKYFPLKFKDKEKVKNLYIFTTKYIIE